jgi:hypothetical protein
MTGVVSPNWYNMTVTIEKGTLRVNKHNYELAALEQVKDLLSFKGIWVNRSYHYRNPNKDLPKDFNKKRESYYNFLNLPLVPKEFTAKLKS